MRSICLIRRPVGWTVPMPLYGQIQTDGRNGTASRIFGSASTVRNGPLVAPTVLGLLLRAGMRVGLLPWPGRRPIDAASRRAPNEIHKIQ